jgi:hypothetical protein
MGSAGERQREREKRERREERGERAKERWNVGEREGRKMEASHNTTESCKCALVTCLPARPEREREREVEERGKR